MNLQKKIDETLEPRAKEAVDWAIQAAQKTNTRLAFVGGLVRDLILDAKTLDVDFMVDHPATAFVDELAALGKAKQTRHEKFFTFVLQFPNGFKVDVATARTETYPKKGALPAVTPARVEDDLRRRDFSINAMGCWLFGGEEGEVFDPLKGLADLEGKLIRALHPNSFLDDPTRVYRAARFAGRLGFEVEQQTFDWLMKSVGSKAPADLSPVRRRNELIAILKEENPVPALNLLHEWGALVLIHPLGAKAFSQASLKEPMNFQEEEKWIEKLARFLSPLPSSERKLFLDELEFSKMDKKEIVQLSSSEPGKGLS